MARNLPVSMEEYNIIIFKKIRKITHFMIKIIHITLQAKRYNKIVTMILKMNKSKSNLYKMKTV